MPNVENGIRAAAAQIHIVLNGRYKLAASDAADIGIADTVGPGIGAEYTQSTGGTSLHFQLHRMIIRVAYRLRHVDGVESTKGSASRYRRDSGARCDQFDRSIAI